MLGVSSHVNINERSIHTYAIKHEVNPIDPPFINYINYVLDFIFN